MKGHLRFVVLEGDHAVELARLPATIGSGDESDVRRIDPGTGEVLERLEMPAGVGVSGLESDGGGLLFCGGGASGKVRAVRRPGRGGRPA